MSEIFSDIAILFGVTGGIGGLISLLSTGSRKPTRSELAKANTVKERIELFGLNALYASERTQNVLFGARIRSLRAYAVSAFISVTVTATYLTLSFDFSLIMEEKVGSMKVLHLMYSLIFFNVLLDIASTIQTRIYFRWVRELIATRWAFLFPLVLVLDYLISVLLTPVGVLFLALFIFHRIIESPDFGLTSNLALMVYSSPVIVFCDIFGLGWPFDADTMFSNKPFSFDGVISGSVESAAEANFIGLAAAMVFSSLTTSFWLWLFVLGEILFRIALLSTSFVDRCYEASLKYDSFTSFPAIASLVLIALIGVPWIVFSHLSVMFLR